MLAEFANAKYYVKSGKIFGLSFEDLDGSTKFNLLPILCHVTSGINIARSSYYGSVMNKSSLKKCAE